MDLLEVSKGRKSAGTYGNHLARFVEGFRVGRGTCGDELGCEVYVILVQVVRDEILGGCDWLVVEVRKDGI